jgi:hypothetical protein
MGTVGVGCLEQFQEEGFYTQPFPDALRSEMLAHIEERIYHVAGVGREVSIEKAAASIEDGVWARQMHRAFRMFFPPLADKIYRWAHKEIASEFGVDTMEINRVSQTELSLNPQLQPGDLVVYWRAVRPFKPDAGRPHRDGTFWELELAQGYDPQITFPFDYLKDCVKVWIPLRGCSEKTSLQIVPRSHKMDIPISIDETDFGKRPTIGAAWLQQYGQAFMSPPPLARGSCIVFDMDLVHQGPRHEQDQLRISAELSLIFKKW